MPDICRLTAHYAGGRRMNGSAEGLEYQDHTHRRAVSL
jgi:hypothetical protein